MRLTVSIAVTLCSFSAMSAVVCRADPATQPTATTGPAMTVDSLLDALDQRGKSLNDFDADVKLVDQDTGLVQDTTRTGRVWYQKQVNAEERIRVLLDKRLTNGGKLWINEPIEYVLTGGWLTDRDYTKRIEVRRQVLRPGQKANLLKLGEGPFPLPIGQDKADVEKMFTVTLMRPDPKEDPPGTGHLLLKPIKGTQFERKFESIDIWVNPADGMPARIDTAHGSRTVETRLSNVRVNTGLKDSDFALQPIKVQDWNVHEEPFNN